MYFVIGKQILLDLLNVSLQTQGAPPVLESKKSWFPFGKTRRNSSATVKGGILHSI